MVADRRDSPLHLLRLRTCGSLGHRSTRRLADRRGAVDLRHRQQRQREPGGAQLRQGRRWGTRHTKREPDRRDVGDRQGDQAGRHEPVSNAAAAQAGQAELKCVRNVCPRQPRRSSSHQPNMSPTTTLRQPGDPTGPALRSQAPQKSRISKTEPWRRRPGQDPVYAVSVGRALLRLAPLGAALLLVPCAAAGDWLPHPKGASWTYSWKDSEYSPTPTKEKVTVGEQKGDAFTLAWTTEGLEQSPGRRLERRNGLVPGDEHGAREHELVEQTAADRLPDPLPASRLVREQPGERLLQRDLGHAPACAGRAVDPRRVVGGDGRLPERSLQLVRLPGHRDWSPSRRFPSRCEQPRFAPRSARPVRSATRTGAASARSGGSTASGR